jgi:hypothetical protein
MEPDKHHARMDIVRGFNNRNVQNWRFILVFPQQKIELVVSDTYWNSSAANFCELSFAGTPFVNAATLFLFGAVFHLCFDCACWIFEKGLIWSIQSIYKGV